MPGDVRRRRVAAVAVASWVCLAACTATPPGPPAATSPVPATSSASAGPALDGTAYYYRPVPNGTQVLSLAGGKVTSWFTIPTPAGDACVTNTVLVSPDGQWLVWANSTGAPDGISGTLSVARLDGTARHTVLGVVCALTQDAWSADSRRITVTPLGTSGQVSVNVAEATTTTPTPAPAQPPTVWSANHAFKVTKSGNGFVVETAAGALAHRVDSYRNDFGGFDTCGYTLKGLSNDGRYVAIGTCATDPQRILQARYLYDTVRNAHVTLPVARPDAVVLYPGFAVVHGPGTLALLSLDGPTVATVTEPAELAQARFLSYTPVPA